jgi:hypothetical protein
MKTFKAFGLVLSLLALASLCLAQEPPAKLPDGYSVPPHWHPMDENGS